MQAVRKFCLSSIAAARQLSQLSSFQMMIAMVLVIGPTLGISVHEETNEPTTTQTILVTMAANSSANVTFITDQPIPTTKSPIRAKEKYVSRLCFNFLQPIQQ